MQLTTPEPLNDYRCPKSIHHPYGEHETATRFRTEKNGDLCCAFCGALHPVQFMELVDHIIEHKGADEVYLSSGKPGKVYLERPEITNAEQGAVKFYYNHLLVVPEFTEPWHDGHPTIAVDVVSRINEARRLSARHFDQVVLPRYRAKIAEGRAKRFRN